MNKKILIVDDNKGDRNLIKEALANAGLEYQFIDAETANQGIEFAQEHIPDLIIMDVLMPGTNGREAIQFLKNEKKTANIPIMLLTSTYPKAEEEVYGKITVGDCVYDSISKPFEEKKLVSKIKQYV